MGGGLSTPRLKYCGFWGGEDVPREWWCGIKCLDQLGHSSPHPVSCCNSLLIRAVEERGCRERSSPSGTYG